MSPKAKSRFVCDNCGYVAAKWLGRCPECSEWNSLIEQADRAAQPAGSLSSHTEPVAIGEVPLDQSPRFPTGVGELDRVLGGGLVPGSLVLLGGDPGIGKSTLLLQALVGLDALYVSGEESVQQ